MPAKSTYEFAVIRVVPRVEREEFLNVGVILYCKRPGFLALKYHLYPARLSCFAAELDHELLHDHLRAWEQVCAGRPLGGRIGELEPHVRFRWLTAPRSTIIQSSPTHPGLLAGEPERVLDQLFECYVG